MGVKLASLETFEPTYVEIELIGFDDSVRIYQIPQPVVWTFKPDRPAPVQPVVEMTVATGRVQKRGAKEGDPEFDRWQEDRARWEEEADAIQMDAALVLALRDVEYPEDLSQPPPWLSDFEAQYPTSDVSRKAFWLKATLLANPLNYTRVMEAYSQMAFGEGEVQDLKNRFRPALQEDSGGTVAGNGSEESD